MSINNPNLQQSQSTISATKDSWMAEAQPTNKRGAQTTASLGHTSASMKRKSLLEAFDTSAWPKGKVVSGDLVLPTAGTQTAAVADACSIYRLRRTWVELTSSWTDYDTGLAWTTPGARSTVSDIFSTNKASFNLPIASESSVDTSIVALLQDHLDSGDTELGLMVEDDTVGDGSAANTWTLSTREGSGAATIKNVVIIPEPYYTWLEAEELVGNVHDINADIILQMGTRSFASSDSVRIKASKTDPTLATGFGVSQGHGLTSVVAGDIVKLTGSEGLINLTPDTRYWYRVEFSTDNETSWTVLGSIRSFVTLPTPGTPGTNHTIVLLGDDHRLKTKIDADTNVLTVQDKTAENIAAELAEDSVLPGFLFHVGDHVLTKTVQSIYPLAADGTGTPSSPTKGYALSQQDADEAARFYRNHVEWPMHSMCPIMARGNHEAGHNFHYLEADGGPTGSTNQVAEWTLNALIERFGLPSSLPTSPSTGACYWTSAEAQALGQYYAFEIGDTLVCVLDDYMHSVHSGTLSDPLPNTYNAIADWSLGTEQFNFFFDLTTGVVATRGKKNVILLHHNKVGGRVLNTQGGNHYGRGGAQYARQDLETEGVDYTTGAAEDRSEWMLTVHPRLAELRSALNVNILDIEGHDHIHQFVRTVDGVAYIHTMQPGCTVGTDDPYGDGFIGAGRYNNSPFTWSPNAGHYLIDPTANGITVKAKRAYVSGLGVTDPSDEFLSNSETFDTLLLGITPPTIGSPVFRNVAVTSNFAALSDEPLVGDFTLMLEGSGADAVTILGDDGTTNILFGQNKQIELEGVDLSKIQAKGTGATEAVLIAGSTR